MTDVALRFGLDVWVASGAALRADRIAYVGSRASVAADGSRTGLQVLQGAGARVEAVWAPEHGFAADGAPGAAVSDGASASGVPVYGLYGKRTRPDAHMLAAVDTIVFDLQDVGARYYTFWHVLKRCLEAARDADKRIVVCERPNPLGSAQWGNVLPADADAQVGCWPLAMQHGVTTADVAIAWHRTHPEVVLECARVAGWCRDAEWDALRVRWTPPSPNLPTLDAVAAYPGTCLGEGLNLSVGRGTPWPFQWLGAPWLDPGPALEAVNMLHCGWRAHTESCTPAQDPYKNEPCFGVRLERTGEPADPVLPALTILTTLLATQREACQFHESHFDALAGGAALREGLLAGADAATLMHSWDTQRKTVALQPIDL